MALLTGAKTPALLSTTPRERPEKRWGEKFNDFRFLSRSSVLSSLSRMGREASLYLQRDGSVMKPNATDSRLGQRSDETSLTATPAMAVSAILRIALEIRDHLGSLARSHAALAEAAPKVLEKLDAVLVAPSQSLDKRVKPDPVACAVTELDQRRAGTVLSRLGLSQGNGKPRGR